MIVSKKNPKNNLTLYAARVLKILTCYVLSERVKPVNRFHTYFSLLLKKGGGPTLLRFWIRQFHLYQTLQHSQTCANRSPCVIRNSKINRNACFDFPRMQLSLLKRNEQSLREK